MYGWTGTIARVDVGTKTVTRLVTDDYSRLFLGGLGIGEKLYWDGTRPGTQAFDPQNLLIMMTGPLCATTAPAAPRMAVCGKSPCTRPERFVNASIAGFFPATLKMAGYDGLVLTGRADRPVYLDIAGGRVVFRDASHLWGRTTSEARTHIAQELGEGCRVLAIGPGGENGARIGNLIGDLGGSASMGFGSVMGAMNVKAIAARGTGHIPEADPEGVRQVRQQLRRMTGPGFHNIYGDTVPMPGTETVRRVHCHGCPQGCWRSLQRRASGLEGIRKCHMGSLYAKWDMQLHGQITDVTFQAADLVNDYGLCTDEIMFLLLWLERCLQGGIIRPEQTGLPVSRMGSLEFLQALLEMISRREGFGEVLAEGTVRAAALLGDQAQAVAADFLTGAGRPARTYGPKSFIMSAPVFAVEQRPAITTLHEICQPLTKWALWLKTHGAGSYVSTGVLRAIAERFWGGAEAVDFSTPDGKARAAVCIQDRQYAKECLVLCDLVWPVLDDAGSPDHVGDPGLESRLVAAVTGRDISPEALSRIGARVFALNRAIQLRDGRRGREDDVLSETYFIERAEPPADIFDIYNPERYLPGKGDDLLTHKSRALDREQVAGIMDEYYDLRGWEVASGLLKKDTLRQLELDDIAAGLEHKTQ
jgi:aldehyde:ferredoxin oxidoreductase